MFVVVFLIKLCGVLCFEKESFFSFVFDPGTEDYGDLLLELDTESLVAEGTLQNTCFDLGVFLLDEESWTETELDFYIENECNLEVTSIWIDTKLSSPGNYTLVVRHGNSTLDARNSHELTFSGHFVAASLEQCNGDSWSEVSSLNSNNFYVVGGSMFQDTSNSDGGATSHSHTFSGRSSASNSRVACDGQNHPSAPLLLTMGHDHPVSGTTESVSNDPLHYTILFCKAQKLVFTEHMLGFFALSSYEKLAGKDWHFAGEFVDKFLKGTQSGNPGGLYKAGGENSHNHDIPQSNFYYDKTDSPTHKAWHNQAYQESSNSIPPYIDLVFAKSAREGIVARQNDGIVVMAIGSTPPLGWKRFSPLDGRFLRCGRNYTGVLGGGSDHLHSYTMYDTSGTYLCGFSKTMDDGLATDCTPADHIHGEWSSSAMAHNQHVPEFKYIPFFRRKTSPVLTPIQDPNPDPQDNDNDNDDSNVDDDNDDDDDDFDGGGSKKEGGRNVGGIVFLATFFPLFGVCVVCSGLIFLAIVVVMWRKISKQKKEMSDLLKLDEMEMGLDDHTMARLSINTSLFEVDIKDLDIKKRIGKGGSDTSIFLAKWKGIEVAFKCFQTRTLFSDQDSFDEFEKETMILASLSHPHIACLHPPRVGILMQYCEKGDLKKFLTEFHEDNKEVKCRYPTREKIRILTEISQAMSYIHSSDIIHRDLKLESKLMDFGFSRLVQTKKNTELTQSPEIVKGNTYTTKADVFSFAILAWIFITENFNPYGGKHTEVELLVANDEKMRPKTDKNRIKPGWMVPLLESCWSSSIDDRPDFDALLNTFQKHSNEKMEDEDAGRLLKLKKLSKGDVNKMISKMKREEKRNSRELLERIIEDYFLSSGGRQERTSMKQMLEESQDKVKKLQKEILSLKMKRVPKKKPLPRRKLPVKK